MVAGDTTHGVHLTSNTNDAIDANTAKVTFPGFAGTGNATTASRSNHTHTIANITDLSAIATAINHYGDNQSTTRRWAYSTSDRRLKTNIVDLSQTYSNALDTINKLKPRRFEWTDNYRGNIPEEVKKEIKDDSSSEIGLIYDEIKDIIPEVTQLKSDPKWLETGNTEDYKHEFYGTIDYSTIVAILIQAVQELTTEVNTLKEQIS